MELRTFCRIAGSVKVLAAVIVRAPWTQWVCYHHRQWGRRGRYKHCEYQWLAGGLRNAINGADGVGHIIRQADLHRHTVRQRATMPC